MRPVAPTLQATRHNEHRPPQETSPSRRNLANSPRNAPLASMRHPRAERPNGAPTSSASADETHGRPGPDRDQADHASSSAAPASNVSCPANSDEGQAAHLLHRR